MFAIKDLRAKSVSQLQKQADDLKAELFMLRFKNSTGQLGETHKIDLLRKDIARLLTVLNEKLATEKVAKDTKQTTVVKVKPLTADGDQTKAVKSPVKRKRVVAQTTNKLRLRGAKVNVAKRKKTVSAKNGVETAVVAKEQA